MWKLTCAITLCVLYGAVAQKAFCKLTRHPSVTYFCKVTDPSIVEGKRRCNESEPTGTVVTPECRPNYYHTGILPDMLCGDGSWDYVAVCELECGTTTPKGLQLVLNGVSAERGELPWHAGVYDTTFTPYKQICGGSLISTTVVISAAHCFWKDAVGLRPSNHFAVAVGKIYRPWNNPKDEGAQKSNVSVIRTPPHFSGSAANFQADIALVVLATPVELTVYIRPVCVDFEYTFDSQQLQSGNMGKVAGWGLTAEDGEASQMLKTTAIPYVDIEQCKADLPFDFLPLITVDKICAGTLNGTTLCQGDSGGGLAFPAVVKYTRRYYLRGVVSSARAPTGILNCNANSYTTFTRIHSHKYFIKQLSSSKCILPAYPEHGSYAVTNAPSARPGHTLDFVNLTVSCDRGFEVYGGNPGICSFGRWLNPVSQCININECLTGEARCGQQQLCTDSLGGYTCSCPRGHRLVGDHQCEDVDECQLAGSQSICSEQADCLNTLGSYQCRCHTGFRAAPANDKVCVDVDECMESRAGSLCEHRCNNVWGDYRCSCHSGYRLNSDNRTCSDVDECTEFGSKLLCVGRCHNEPGSYRCTCPGGYRLSEDKRSCIDIDECETDENSCAAGLNGDIRNICLNTRGSHRCHKIVCLPGYRLERLNHCTKIEKVCHPNDWECAHQSLTYSYNFITFVSKLFLPENKVVLFVMQGPSWRNATVRSELVLKDVNAPPTVQERADIKAFLLTQTGNQANVSLIRSLEGPQTIELELSMDVYNRKTFVGIAVAKLYIHVSEYEF